MVKKPKLFIALCTLPALILTIVFMIAPMLNAIYLSFTSSTALSVGFNSKFVFFDNYIYMFRDKDFLQALYNTINACDPRCDNLFKPCICVYPHTGTVERKILLPYGILFSKHRLHDSGWYCVVLCF